MKRATQPKPYRIHVQPWAPRYHPPRFRADLLIGSCICKTGYAPTPDGALFALQEALVGTAWEGQHVGAEITFDWRAEQEVTR